MGYTIIRRRLYWAALALAVLALPLSAPGEARAGDRGNLSLCYTTWGKHGGNDLPGKGFIPDLVTRIFTHAGYTVTVDIVPWPRCVNLAKSRQYDGIASAWRGANFDPDFEYLNITLRNDINFVVTAESPIENGEISNFHGRYVGHVRDSGGMDQIREDKQIKTREVPVMTSMITMLVGGRIDAIISDPESLFAAASGMTPPVDGTLKVLQPPLVTNLNSPLIPNGHPKLDSLRKDFDAAFKEMVAGGIYNELIAIHGPEFEYQVPLAAR